MNQINIKTKLITFTFIFIFACTQVYSQDLFKTTWKYAYAEDIKVVSAQNLCHEKKYDEALVLLNTLDLSKTSDPAGFLFYKSVCEYTLLMKNECVLTLNTLLDNENKLPVRYAATAKLMLDDIKGLEEDSLDEIEKLMKDSNRRLSLGRLGKVVRDEEKLIVEKLDKLIKQTENSIKNAQDAPSQSQGKGRGIPVQGTPMKDSEIAGTSGQGGVDQKNISGNSKSWGNMPPKERQEALQKLTKELPSHYREVIEGYFRKLAEQK